MKEAKAPYRNPYDGRHSLSLVNNHWFAYAHYLSTKQPNAPTVHTQQFFFSLRCACLSPFLRYLSFKQGKVLTVGKGLRHTRKRRMVLLSRWVCWVVCLCREISFFQDTQRLTQSVCLLAFLSLSREHLKKEKTDRLSQPVSWKKEESLVMLCVP